MRKFQKQQILEIITSLHFLHQESAQKLAEGEYDTVQTALGDCQEAAIQMGNVIEQTEGEGTPSVACLEHYCEALYQLSRQMELIVPQDFCSQLDEAISQAEKEIDQIRIRKEVVFMPYKASMWDSLESVYLAAKEDENCDAYVVPIPYFDKNLDGSLGQMHYEGGEYPPDIEVVFYEDYHLEERRPDAIYIHNPYDNWNYVTSVPEYYYSSNLKKYTEQLVYIPYFVLSEIKPDEQDKIDKMKHFCFLPGIIFADKVIVQSEDMRQIYINEFLKEAKANGLTGAYIDRSALEKKILGLGSPKFDKVHSVGREDLNIPAEWRRIIEKPDGTWKKIIFYNTSINALLENDEKMLDKMKSVFDTFKENQSEVALLWRPHPLIRTTIEAMRPKLWAEYYQIVQQYCEEGWGIYDDSADMDRAVVLSDAYYGDQSSVVQLYQETGKPVMIQNVEVL
ncbi:MAG: hypothetical protein NC489_14330 [Ruminococcus flavefaciens]|nr:hypothetical protein [Ruminococcus flavefaciens]